MPGVRCSAVYFSVLLSLLPVSALAAPTEPDNDDREPEKAQTSDSSGSSKEAVKEAIAHYKRGTELYESTDYKLALIEFKRAYELAANYRVLYNIGQVNIQLGNYADARRALEQYLKDGGKEIPQKRREEVEKDIAQLQARTAHIGVTPNVPDAMVQIDDEAPSKGPLTSVLIDAGQHRITVTKEGYKTATKMVTLAPEDDVTVPIALAPAEKSERIVERHYFQANERPSYLWAGWVASGVLAAGAVTTGILALSAKSSLESNLDDGKVSPADVESNHDKARVLGYVTDGLAGAAIIAAGVTLYLTLKKPSSQAGSTRVGFGPGAIRVSGSF